MTSYFRMAEHLRLPSTTATWPRTRHRRFTSGAPTNPDLAVFAKSALQVKEAMDATRKIVGEDHVLWGGREGYETLLNRCIGPELDQMGRFMNRMVE